MTATWDFIVIGAGHNGLSAACTLAEAGRSVLVVDALPYAGGLAASVAHVAAAPSHLLSVGAMDDVYMAATGLAEVLELPRHGYQRIALEHPYGWMNEDGDSLLLFKDFARSLDEIRHHSPRDARTYEALQPTFDWLLDLQQRLAVTQPRTLRPRELLGIALKLAVDRPLRRTLLRMATMNIFDLIGETFESEAMRGLWAYWTSMLGPVDQDGSGFYLTGFAGVHRGLGAQRPRGGMSGLIGAFIRKLEAHGGALRLNCGVDRILVDERRTIGLRLADGQVLSARQGVIATCAPQVTFGTLLDPTQLDERLHQRVDLMPANLNNVGPLKIDIAVGGALAYPRAEAKRRLRDDVDLRKTTFMTGTLGDHIEQLRAIRRGETLSLPPVYFSILSAADPGIAPDGQGVVYLHAHAPVQARAGAANRITYEACVLASAGRFIDGLDAEIGHVTHAPEDFERIFATPRGCYFHVDMSMQRMGRNRPAAGLGDYRTPIEGLFLGGAGTHPGGGISGWPGRLAAQAALG